MIEYEIIRICTEIFEIQNFNYVTRGPKFFMFQTNLMICDVQSGSHSRGSTFVN